MRPTLLVLLLLAAALAGCSGDGGDDHGDDHDGMDGHGMDGMDGSTVNEPPVATLAANVTQGPAPLLVQFDIGGSDPDDDNVTWSLDADGDGVEDAAGDALPGSAEFSFDLEGNYTATVTVSDGTNETAATIGITVEAGLPAGGQTITGDIVLSVLGCLLAQAADNGGVAPWTGAPGTASGVSWIAVEAEPLTYGLPYTAEFTEATVGHIAYYVIFADADGDVLQFDSVDGPALGGATLEGTVPADAAWVLIHGCSGPALTGVTYVAGAG